jgi:hypothetical protein
LFSIFKIQPIPCVTLEIQYTLVISPAFGPSYILAVSYIGNISREQFTYINYKRSENLNIEMAISEGGGITRVHCESVWL